MRSVFFMAALVLLIGPAWAEMGFDEKYERDYNIFNPINRFQPENPLNPINRFNPNTPFQLLNRSR